MATTPQLVDAIVKINGVDRTGTAGTGINMASLRIEETANTRGTSTKTCSFTVFDESGMSLAEEQTVVVQDAAGSNIWFNGFIASISRDQIWTARGNAAIQCANYARYMEKCEDLYDDAGVAFTDETDTTIIHNVMDVCCPDIECTLYVEEIDDDLSMAFDHVTAREMMDQVCQKTGGIWYVDDGPVASANVTNEMLSGGFETAGAGGGDVFANWEETLSDGAIDDETVLVKVGSHAAKLTAGPNALTRLSQTVTVQENWDYTWTMWTRGDGTYAGRYWIRDLTNDANIAATTTGVTGTTYTEVTVNFTIPAGCTSISLRVRCPSTDTGIAYFDGMTLKRSYQVHLHYFRSPLDSASELATNGGFETAGGGGADIWANWSENVGDGALANETSIVRTGSDSAKLTAGPASTCYLFSDNIPVTAGYDYNAEWYTYGDGTNYPQVAVYDVTNAAWIVTITNADSAAAAWNLTRKTFTAPAGCANARIYCLDSLTNGAVVYFDDVSLRRSYNASWNLLGDTGRADGQYYRDLKKTTKAPECNRIRVLGAGTVDRVVTSGSRDDYGRWISKIHRDKSIKDNAEADATGAAILYHSIATDSYTCTAYRWDAVAGQVIGLTSSLYSLTDERLDIKRITTSFKGGKAGGTPGEYLVECEYELGRFLPQLKDVLAQSGRAGPKLDELEWEMDHLDFTGSLATTTLTHSSLTGATASSGAHPHDCNGYTEDVAESCIETTTVSGHKHVVEAVGTHAHDINSASGGAGMALSAGAHDHDGGTLAVPNHSPAVVTGIGTLAIEVVES